MSEPANGNVSRRHFLALGAALPVAALGAGVVRAQQPAPTPAPPLQTPVESPTPNQITGSAVTAPDVPGATMEGDGYRPVRRAAKPNARPSMSADARDALEHELSCPCPCTLDVFTCRTSMPCGFSPAIHKDVVALVEGGYSGDEILDAFVKTYGTEILMAPPKSGFNLAGWFAPFAALGTGAVVIAALMRRWSARAAAVAATNASRSSALPAPASTARADAGDPVGYTASDAATLGATPDELARLEALVRGEAGPAAPGR